jgi:hypothetical protein
LSNAINNKNNNKNGTPNDWIVPIDVSGMWQICIFVHNTHQERYYGHLHMEGYVAFSSWYGQLPADLLSFALIHAVLGAFYGTLWIGYYVRARETSVQWRWCRPATTTGTAVEYTILWAIMVASWRHWAASLPMLVINVTGPPVPSFNIVEWTLESAQKALLFLLVLVISLCAPYKNNTNCPMTAVVAAVWYLIVVAGQCALAVTSAVELKDRRATDAIVTAINTILLNVLPVTDGCVGLLCMAGWLRTFAKSLGKQQQQQQLRRRYRWFVVMVVVALGISLPMERWDNEDARILQKSFRFFFLLAGITFLWWPSVAVPEDSSAPHDEQQRIALSASLSSASFATTNPAEIVPERADRGEGIVVRRKKDNNNEAGTNL